MSSWSIEALSSHTIGGRRCSASKALAHEESALNLAAPSSCHEWLMNASHPPRESREVFALRPESALDPRSALPMEEAGRPRKVFLADASTSAGRRVPMRAATAAAARSMPRPPRRESHDWMRLRTGRE